MIAANLRQTFRTLRESLGLTVTILLTIALGIGANTAIFTVVYATLLASPPYPQADRLVNVWSKLQGHRIWASSGDFTDWKRQSTAFEDLNAYGTNNFIVGVKDRPEYLAGLNATQGYYRMLGSPLFLGRNFRPEEGEPGKEHVVILTHRLWQHLGANPKIIGQTTQINGEPYTVVGVLAAGTADRWIGEFIVPLVFKPEQLNNHDSHYWLVTGRLKPGVTVQQAQAEMDAIAAQLAKDYPKTNQDWGVMVEPFKNDFLPRNMQRMLWLLLGGVGFLLLIACVNVANLLLAKGITRQREIAISGAMGATPKVIFAQVITEGLVLAILAGVVGVCAGYAMLQGLIAVMPSDALPAEADLRLNVPILLVTLAAATLAGLFSSCVPAWYASRVDPAGVLKEGARSGTGGGRHKLRRILVIAEFALALPLLAGAGMTIHSFWNLTHVDLGVRTDHILGFYLDSVPIEKDNFDQAKVESYYRGILGAIQAVPGVSDVCAMTYLPLDSLHSQMAFTTAGQPDYANAALRPNADFETVTPDYFRTSGIRVVNGRAFTEYDNGSSIKVAMVNEAFPNRFLKGIDPLKQRLVMEQVTPGQDHGPLVEWQIVGVFHTVKSRDSREDNPEINTPFWQEAYSVSGIAIRTVGDPAAMLKSASAAVNAIDPQAAFLLPRTMEQVHNQVLGNDWFTLILFGSFAVIALLLATVGIYGVMAFSVTQRSREMALRMALGATRSRVVSLVMKEGLVLTAAGLGLGLIGAYFVGRAMQSILFGVAPVDFSAFAAVGVVLVLAAVLACYLPALRAATVEIMQALRAE